jgi:hypothetical protein
MLEDAGLPWAAAITVAYTAGDLDIKAAQLAVEDFEERRRDRLRQQHGERPHGREQPGAGAAAARDWAERGTGLSSTMTGTPGSEVRRLLLALILRRLRVAAR